MFNTSAQLPECDATMDRRLAELSAYDPVAADQIRSALPSASRGQHPPSDPMDEQIQHWGGEEGQPDILVVMGAPGVQEMEALFSRFPDSCQILMLESNLPRAAHLFKSWPMEQRIKEGRLVLAMGSDEKHVETRFLPLVNLRKAPVIRMLEMAWSPAEETAFYQSALMRVKKSVHLSVFNVGTLVYRGPLWQHNTIKNLPQLIANPGVAALERLFPAKPAVVVGAGPSLQEALPFLARAKNHFVILSTGTALRPLQKAGIRPDIVMSVDGSKKTAPQFETDCSDLFLACSSLSFPPILSKFKGIFSASMSANPISEWLNGFGDPKGTLIAAGTVTTTAMDLALRMGCNPVICLGADLSFKDDGTTHVANSMYQGSKLDPSKLIPVPGNFKDQVLTTAQFKCYIDLMEDFIGAQPDTRFVNCTTGGARIKGMQLAHPSELLTMASGEVQAYDRIRLAHTTRRTPPPSRLLDELAGVLEELEEVKGLTHQAAMLCNQLIMILRAPHAGDRDVAQARLMELQEIDGKLASLRRCSTFLDMSLWPIGYQTGMPRGKHEEIYSDGILANRRSRTLYEQIAGAAKWTHELLSGIMPGIRASTGAESGHPGRSESQERETLLDVAEMKAF
ncbi:MAG: 6-hydroxymethylpterin diphosphokinase MptE-like protein [Lentisphaerota bacterium]